MELQPEERRLLRSLREHHKMLHENSNVGLPILDAGNYEFKSDPFKIGVEAMSDLGAFPREHDPFKMGAFPRGFDAFKLGGPTETWHPGGGQWGPNDTYVPGGGFKKTKRGWYHTSWDNDWGEPVPGVLNARGGKFFKRFQEIAGLPPDNIVAGFPREYDPFKVGGPTPIWHPGGGQYDEYTGQYVPGGGWHRGPKGWTHTSYYDADMIPAPGVGPRNFPDSAWEAAGWPNEYDAFKMGANPAQMLRRMKRKHSFFRRLKKVPWMKRRQIQRTMAAKLMKRVAANDPRAKAALAKIKRLAASNGNARRLLRDIAQIAVCYRAQQGRASFRGWPRAYDPYKVGHASNTLASGAALMAQLGAKR